MTSAVAGDIFLARLIEVPQGVVKRKQDVLRLQQVIITEHDRVLGIGATRTDAPLAQRHSYLTGFAAGMWAGHNPKAWFRMVNTHLYLYPGEAVEVTQKGGKTNPDSVSFGASWEMTEGKAVDLDIGCLMMDTDLNMVDFVNFQQLRSSDSSVRHGGDERSDKEGDVDDEYVTVQLDQVPESVSYLAFYLTSFTGRPLHDVESCSGHLYETQSKKEIALFDSNSPEIKERTAIFLAVLCRSKSRWFFVHISSCTDGNMLQDNLSHAHRSVLVCKSMQRISFTSLQDKNDLFRTDVTYITRFMIRVGYAGGDTEVFGASLVMFDRQGRFIDGVDSRRVQSRRGPVVRHGFTAGRDTEDMDREEFVIDLQDARQDDVFVYFLVINGRTEHADLSRLGSIRAQMFNCDSEVMYCDYRAAVETRANGFIMIRIDKDSANPKKWNFRAVSHHGDMEQEYGYLIPCMSRLMLDTVPDCQCGPNDNNVYLSRDQYVGISALYTDPLNSVSLGVKWEPLEEKKISPDFSCCLMTRDYNIIETVNSSQTVSSDGSISLGEMKTEKVGDEDDQQLHVNLSALASSVTFVCFYLMGTSGNALDHMSSCCARLIDSDTKRDLILLDCDDDAARGQQSLLLGVLIRVGRRWFFYNGCIGHSGIAHSENSIHAQAYILASPVIQSILIVSLSKREEWDVDISGWKSIRIRTSWEGSDGVNYGASLVMLNQKGEFVDGVDSRRYRSQRGPKVRRNDLNGNNFEHDEFIIDLEDPRQSNVSLYYVIVNCRIEGVDLSDIRNVGMRIIGGEKEIEFCRYAMPTLEQTSGLVLARIWKNPQNSSNWIVKALGESGFRRVEKEYGYMLPRMIEMLSDVIPEITSGPKDNTAYLLPTEMVNIEDLSTNPLDTVCVGVKWVSVDNKRTDLDLGCMLLTPDLELVDYVSYQKLASNDDAVKHGGDTRGGQEGDMDDEEIRINLQQLSPNISFLGFYLTSFNGNLLADVDSCCARLLDFHTKRDVALMDCDSDEIKRHTALLLCMLFRVGSKWYFLNGSDCSIGTALPENLDHLERYILDSIPIQRLLRKDLTPQINHRINVFHMQAVKLGISFNGGDTEVFGASLVMFDRQGRFIDGVDSRRVQSRRGPVVRHVFTAGRDTEDMDREEFVIDLQDARQDDVFVYFLVINGRTEHADLSRLGSIRVRFVNQRNEIENCRYEMEVSVSSKGIVLCRLWKDPKNWKKWILRALDQPPGDEIEYGFLIPQMRSLMSDIIPGCVGSIDDRVAYLTQFEYVDIASLSIEPIGSVTIGANWEIVQGSSADIDLGCMLFDSNLSMLDYVSYQKMSSNDGAVIHGGDYRGDKNSSEDDESVRLRLDALPDDVRFIAFYVTSYTGGPLTDLMSCGVHLYNSESSHKLAMLDCYDPKLREHPSTLLCMLIKSKSRWNFMNFSSMSVEKTLLENVSHIQNSVRLSTQVMNLFSYDLVPLSANSEHRIDVSYMRSFKVSVSWTGKGSESYGASLVMFDRQGRFIDGVDSRRVKSRRGPSIFCSSSNGCDDFSIVLTDRRLDKISVFFIILNGRTDDSNLENLKSIKMSCIDGDVDMEMTRYDVVAIQEKSKALVLARISRTDSYSKILVLKALRQIRPTGKEYGYTLPHLKNSLADMIPGSRAASNDYTVFLVRDTLADIANLSSEPLSSISIGVSWATATGHHMDLNLSCLMFTKIMELHDTVNRSREASQDRSVFSIPCNNHDKYFNLNDKIAVLLHEIPTSVSYLMFFLQSPTGSNLEGLCNTSLYVTDSASERDIVMMDFDESDFKRFTALQLGLLMKVKSRWFFLNTSMGLTQKSPLELQNVARNFISRDPVVRDPFSQVKVSLSEREEFHLETLDMKSLELGVSWDGAHSDFSAALVSFDEHGDFIDGVDCRRRISKKGPSMHYRNNAGSDTENFMIDLLANKQRMTLTYFLVITGKTERSELRKLSKIRLRVVESEVTFCDFETDVKLESSRAIILARLHKESETIWVIKTYREMSLNENDYGYLIPRMKGLMLDIIPDVNISPRDFTIYVNRDENVNLESLSSTNISTLTINVAWDNIHGDVLDLDLGCMMLAPDTSFCDHASFAQKESKTYAARHLGDNISQNKVVNAESIQLSLMSIPEDIQFVAFYLTSFSGTPITNITDCNVSVSDASTNREVVLCDCMNYSSDFHVAMLLFVIFRTRSGWFFHNSSSYADGLLLRDNLEHAQTYISNNQHILRALSKHRRDSIRGAVAAL